MLTPLRPGLPFACRLQPWTVRLGGRVASDRSSINHAVLRVRRFRFKVQILAHYNVNNGATPRRLDFLAERGSQLSPTSKIDSLKAAITSQLIDIAPPPLDSVCSLPSLQLLDPFTSFEVSKLLSIIPPKFCCLDYVATAIIKQCFSVFFDLIAYMANLSFSQGTFPSKFKHASITPLLKKPGLDPSVSC